MSWSYKDNYFALLASSPGFLSESAYQRDLKDRDASSEFNEITPLATSVLREIETPLATSISEPAPSSLAINTFTPISFESNENQDLEYSATPPLASSLLSPHLLTSQKILTASQAPLPPPLTESWVARQPLYSPSSPPPLPPLPMNYRVLPGVIKTENIPAASLALSQIYSMDDEDYDGDPEEQLLHTSVQYSIAQLPSEKLLQSSETKIEDPALLFTRAKEKIDAFVLAKHTYFYNQCKAVLAYLQEWELWNARPNIESTDLTKSTVQRVVTELDYNKDVNLLQSSQLTGSQVDNNSENISKNTKQFLKSLMSFLNEIINYMTPESIKLDPSPSTNALITTNTIDEQEAKDEAAKAKVLELQQKITLPTSSFASKAFFELLRKMEHMGFHNYEDLESFMNQTKDNIKTPEYESDDNYKKAKTIMDLLQPIIIMKEIRNQKQQEYRDRKEAGKLAQPLQVPSIISPRTQTPSPTLAIVVQQPAKNLPDHEDSWAYPKDPGEEPGATPDEIKQELSYILSQKLAE